MDRRPKGRLSARKHSTLTKVLAGVVSAGIAAYGISTVPHPHPAPPGNEPCTVQVEAFEDGSYYLFNARQGGTVAGKVRIVPASYGEIYGDELRTNWPVNIHGIECTWEMPKSSYPNPLPPGA